MNVLTIETADFSRKLLGKTISIAFGNLNVAICRDESTIFLYPNNIGLYIMKEILPNPDILKLVSKPFISSYFGIECKNCQYIGEHVSDLRLLSEMKNELIENFQDITKIAGIMMKYKNLSDVKNSNSTFNSGRDCYLLYLTIFNDILSQNGPMKFLDLINKVNNYSCMCRMKLSASMALTGLIKVGALISDTETTIISLPEQIPK